MDNNGSRAAGPMRGWTLAGPSMDRTRARASQQVPSAQEDGGIE